MSSFLALEGSTYLLHKGGIKKCQGPFLILSVLYQVKSFSVAM